MIKKITNEITQKPQFYHKKNKYRSKYQKQRSVRWNVKLMYANKVSFKMKRTCKSNIKAPDKSSWATMSSFLTFSPTEISTIFRLLIYHLCRKKCNQLCCQEIMKNSHLIFMHKSTSYKAYQRFPFVFIKI